MLTKTVSRSACVAGVLSLAIAGSAFCTSGIVQSINSNFESATTVTPSGPFVILQALVRDSGGPTALGGAADFANANSILSFNALGSNHFYATNQGDWTWAAPSGYFAPGDIVYFTF